MKIRHVFVGVCLSLLWACGPTDAGNEPSADLASASSALNTCTNDCTAWGGPAISCTGTSCTAASNYVVCDGAYTYCASSAPTASLSCTFTSPVVQCTGSGSNGTGLVGAFRSDYRAYGSSTWQIGTWSWGSWTRQDLCKPWAGGYYTRINFKVKNSENVESSVRIWNCGLE